MLHPQTVRVFVQELIKIAVQRSIPGGSVELDRAIRVIRTIPDDKERAVTHLTREVRKTKETPVMRGYANIAIPKSELSKDRLEELGFKGTRLHTRYPGESLRSVSYRKGRLHMHDYPGPLFLMHEDKHAPEGIKQIASHVLSEGLPSLKWFDKSPEARPVKVNT